MLIVGGAAAATAIAVYLAVIAVKSLRHSWSARRTERPITRRDDHHAALRARIPRAGANLSQ